MAHESAETPAAPAGLAIRRVPIDSLHLDPANARSHGTENLEAILGSLKRFEQVEPLVVQKSSGRVIGGNGRLLAMKKLEWRECDVIELDLDDLQATALGIALNRTGDLAAWDEPALAKLLQELKASDALDGVGYSAEDLDTLVSELGGVGGYPEGEDEVPQPPEDAVTRTGDLWLLGSHRLLVGDSASAEDVDRLLAGATIHLLNMDPPYNVRVEPRSNNAIAAGLSSFAGTQHHQALDLARHPEKAKPTERRLRAKDRPLENDFVSDEEFARLLAAWFGNAARVLEPGGSFYIWGGYANCGNYPPALEAAGLYFSQAIIWVKEHPVLTRKDFMGNHEWCQPGDTRVETPDGPVRISSLRDGDRVVSYCEGCDSLTGLERGLAVRTTSRRYSGPLLGVQVGRRTTWCTPGHLWSVRVARSASSGETAPLLVRASDLLPGAMLVPVPARGADARWEPIRAIDRQPFSGDVYSLAVERFGHYVADGLVTHNCFYGWREGAGHEFLGPANATDVWSVKKVNPQSMSHLTEKPVELARRAILYSSRSGENVLDLFAGSGSTLIACEETGRRAYLMEIDRLYADVIVERWQKFAGKEAVLDGTGKTFKDVAQERRETRASAAGDEAGAPGTEKEQDHEDQRPH